MITIVLPAYNEEDAITPLLEKTRLALLSRMNEVRVFVIDDGSTDNTSERVKVFTAFPVALFSHRANRGLCTAIRTGLLAALQEGGADNDTIVTMDADNTHDPNLVLKMVEQIEAGHDLVIASRYVVGARTVGLKWSRKMLSWGINSLLRLLFPVSGVKDYSCGYRAYKAGTLKRAFSYWGDSLFAGGGFSCVVRILLKLRRLNIIATEVPLVLRYDLKPTASKMNVLRNVKDMLGLILEEFFAGGLCASRVRRL